MQSSNCGDNKNDLLYYMNNTENHCIKCIERDCEKVNIFCKNFLNYHRKLVIEFCTAYIMNLFCSTFSFVARHTKVDN